MKKVLIGSAVVVGGTTLAGIALYKYVESKTKRRAEKLIKETKESIEEDLQPLIDAEDSYFEENDEYSDDFKELEPHALALGEDTLRTKVIVNNSVPLAVLELTASTNRDSATLGYMGFGIYSEAVISGNTVLLKGAPATEINWKIQKPSMSLSGPDRKRIQKAVIRQALSHTTKRHRAS